MYLIFIPGEMLKSDWSIGIYFEPGLLRRANELHFCIRNVLMCLFIRYMFRGGSLPPLSEVDLKQGSLLYWRNEDVHELTIIPRFSHD